MEKENKMDQIEQIEDKMKLKVTFIDGTDQEMDVRRVPARKVKSLISDMAEGEEVEVKHYSDKPPGFFDQLSDDSWHDLITTGREINADAIKKFRTRNEQLLKQLGVAEG